MSITPLHHVVLSVTDFDRSVAFYNVLGFKKTLESPVDHPRYEKYLRIAPGTTGRMGMLAADDGTMGMIEVIQWDPPLAATTGPKRVGDPGVCMLALEVHDETLEDISVRLAEHGIELWSGITTVELEAYPPFYTLLIEDPDGLLVELIQLPTREEVKRYRAEHFAAKGG